jgi:hypothetical protein
VNTHGTQIEVSMLKELAGRDAAADNKDNNLTVAWE